MTIAAASGTYTGAAASRNNMIELVVENQSASAVTLNGTALTQHTTQAAFDAAASGWFNAGNNLILAKSGSQSVTSAKTFVFTLTGAPTSTPTVTPGGPTATPTSDGSVSQRFVCYNGTTVTGESVYVVGSIPQLGNWSAASAVKLNADGPYPTWTGTISGLPANAVIEWKCIKRHETGDTSTVVMWQPGSNSVFTSAAAGFGGSTYGNFTAANTATPSGPTPTPTRTPTPTYTPTATPTGSSVSHRFVCNNGTTVMGDSVYVVGNIPQLGNWSAASAVKLNPDGPYPTWTGTISGLPPSTAIQWKCIKRHETGDTSTVVMWEPGANNTLTSAASGFGGTTTGDFLNP